MLLSNLIVSAKSLALLKTWTASLPMLGFIATDWLTGNVGLGVAVSAGFSVLTAIIVTWPKLIAARSAATVNATSAADIHSAAVVKRLGDIHEREIMFWKQAVQQCEKVTILTRATKHKVLSAYQASVYTIRDLEDTLKAHNVTVERYVPEKFADITGAEDDETIKMLFLDHK